MRPITLVLALLTVAAAGCNRGPTEPTALGGLSQSQQLLLPEVTVTFVEVKSDSRCPINALCVWSGNAVVVVAAQKPFTRMMPALFEVNTHVEPRSFDFDNVTIRLDSLTPYATGVPIPQDKYVAYFSVVRR